jgi:transcription elongation factor GreB
MARALLKKAVDEEVTVNTPSGPATWFIVQVRYIEP